VRRVADIDWARWQPRDPATLLFVVDVARGHVLLIRKKRGLGAGKINGPGGRLEPGESPVQAAVREVEEEVGVVPLRPQDRGVLRFQFVDGYSLRVHVFVATAWRGQPRETAEAVPRWVDLRAIPWDEMWADDRLWLPHALAGRRVDGRFVFDGDAMLDHELSIEASDVAEDAADSA
jgi:8-oxo-dGTP diphosphatase